MIYIVNNNNILDEAVNYVTGCINEQYEIDSELLEMCAMYILLNEAKPSFAQRRSTFWDTVINGNKKGTTGTQQSSGASSKTNTSSSTSSSSNTNSGSSSSSSSNNTNSGTSNSYKHYTNTQSSSSSTTNKTLSKSELEALRKNLKRELASLANKYGINSPEYTSKEREIVAKLSDLKKKIELLS